MIPWPFVVNRPKSTISGVFMLGNIETHIYERERFTAIPRARSIEIFAYKKEARSYNAFSPSNLTTTRVAE